MPGEIKIKRATFELPKDEFVWPATGTVLVKTGAGWRPSENRSSCRRIAWEGIGR